MGHKPRSGGVKDRSEMDLCRCSISEEAGFICGALERTAIVGIGAKQDGLASDPNVVPLIDVLLVLIIIFMVITPTVPAGLPALIPQPSPSSSEPATIDTVVVRVMDSGLMINQEPCDWDALGGRMFNIFKERADKVAFVGGADEVPFAEVARAIDIMRTAGVDRVGLVTPSTISEE